MADVIFRPTYHAVIPADAKIVVRDGQRIARFKSKGGKSVEGLVLPCGTRCRVATPGYYARIKYPDGRVRRVSLGVTDQEAARQLRSQLQREADQEKAGIIDASVRHQKTPLIGMMTELPKRKHQRNQYGKILHHSSDLAREDLYAAMAGSHLADYAAHLLAGGRTQRHVDELVRLIRRVALVCGFEFPGDLDSTVLERHLVALITAGKSFRTRNAALKYLRAFINWMVRTNRLGKNPFKTIATLNEEADPQRRQRRALTADEFTKLLAATEKAGVIEGLDGPQRRTLYLLAAWTGLRKSELAALRIADLVLDSDPPYVHLRAAAAKARRDDQPIPLHPFVASQVSEWLRTRTKVTATTVFDLTTRGGYLRKTSKMMELDCASAGIRYHGDLGTSDFHSIRVQFITALCRSADFSTAVELARHKDPRLTSRVYDRVRLEDRTAAINGLALPTGLDNLPAKRRSRGPSTDSRRGKRTA